MSHSPLAHASVSALLAGASPAKTSGMAQLAQVLRGVEQARDPYATHAVLEALAAALASFPNDGGKALISSLTSHEDAIPQILEMLESDPVGTRAIFARLSPIEAVRFLRFLDRQDPIGSEHILRSIRAEDPELAMRIYGAFQQGAQGGYHNPQYRSGGYNSKDGITLAATDAFPMTYSFFRS